MDRVMKITRRECLLALFSALTVVVCVCSEASFFPASVFFPVSVSSALLPHALKAAAAMPMAVQSARAVSRVVMVFMMFFYVYRYLK